jgi:hypothetical protein
MEHKTKSLNCYSCGAGLIRKIQSNICKCSYCKNNNLILEDGSTKIVDLIEQEPKQKNENKLPIWIYFLIPLMCLVPMLILFWHKGTKEKRIIEKNGEIKVI